MSEMKDIDKRKVKNFRRVIVAIVLVGCLIGGGIYANKGGSSDKSNADESDGLAINEEYGLTMRDTKFDFSGGEMKITRTRVEDKSENLDDSWTILKYICGSDQETDKGSQSKVLDNMLGSDVNADNIGKVNFIVQTGGANNWHGSYGKSDKLTRMKLNAQGQFEVIEELDNKSMADPDTLAEFLEWGFTNYPAKNTMFIISDHGGPENDMCYDENYEFDPLTINELEYAFAKSKSALQAPIDIVFTHTCSNGTIELANALAPYADRLITAPSYSAAYGFSYKKLVNSFLEEDNSPDTVVDKFLSAYKATSIVRFSHRPVYLHY